VFVLHQQELFLKRLKKEGKRRTSKYNIFRQKPEHILEL
jgi:hypothetical protein